MDDYEDDYEGDIPSAPIMPRRMPRMRSSSGSNAGVIFLLMFFLILIILVVGFVYYYKINSFSAFQETITTLVTPKPAPLTDLNVRFIKIANNGDANPKPLKFCSIEIINISNKNPIIPTLIKKNIEPIVTSSGMMATYSDNTTRAGTTKDLSWSDFVFGTQCDPYNFKSSKGIKNWSSDTANKDTFYQIDLVEPQQAPIGIIVLSIESQENLLSYQLELYNSNKQLLDKIQIKHHEKYQYSVINGIPKIEILSEEDFRKIMGIK